MKPNEIAKKVCAGSGHKIVEMNYGTGGMYCFMCGLSLEEIRDEGLAKGAPSDGS